MRKEFYKKVKGPMAENEDWWYLLDNEDGTQLVEHEWSHLKINGLKGNSGKEQYSIDAFVAGDNNASAIAALKRLLGL